MGETISDIIIKFSNDIITQLSEYADDLVQAINDAQILSESQIHNLNTKKTPASKVSYLLNSYIIPRLKLGQLNVFELLVRNFMLIHKDPSIQSLAKELLDETAVTSVPTIDSQEATEIPPASESNMLMGSKNATTVPTQDSQLPTPNFKEELVTSNGSSLQHPDLHLQTIDKSWLLEKELQKILNENDSFKVQFSVVKCIGIPKAGKTSFTDSLMEQPSDFAKHDGDHCTVFFKRQSNSNKNVKWEKISLSKLTNQLSSYVKFIQNKKERAAKDTGTTNTTNIPPTHNDLEAEIASIKSGEIWSILVMLDISVPTAAIDLLPASKITFVTCRVCDLENRPLESSEFSCFIDALMSSNSFKATPEQNHLFDKLIHQNCKNNRSYTSFVGVYQKSLPELKAASINSKLMNMHKTITQLKSTKVLSYPYWCVSVDKLLYSVDITDPNDAYIKRLRNQMEEQLSQSTIYNVPITWLLLYLEILKMFGKTKNPYLILYMTVFSSAWKGLCNIQDEKELKTALSFFHCQGALQYFKDVSGMHEYIFKDPRWHFEQICYVLYNLQPACLDYSACSAFEQMAVFNEQMISESTYEGEIQLCYILQLLVQKKFAFLLKCFGNEDYFIPSILKGFDLNSASSKVQLDSLLVTFSCGSFHRLLFSALAAHLLDNLPPLWGHPGTNEKNIFSNKITFPVDEYFVTFIDRVHFLEIQIHHTQKSQNVPEQCLFYQITKALNNACSLLDLNNYNITFGFWCHDCSYEENHMMILCKDTLKAICCFTNQHKSLSDCHRTWITEVSSKTPMQEWPSGSTNDEPLSANYDKFGSCVNPDVFASTVTSTSNKKGQGYFTDPVEQKERQHYYDPHSEEITTDGQTSLNPEKTPLAINSPFKRAASLFRIDDIEFSVIEKYLISEDLIKWKEQYEAMVDNYRLPNQKKRAFRDMVLSYNLEECKRFVKCLEKSADECTSHKDIYVTLNNAIKTFEAKTKAIESTISENPAIPVEEPSEEITN